MTKFSCKLLDNFKVIDTHGRTSPDMTTFSVFYYYNYYGDNPSLSFYHRLLTLIYFFFLGSFSKYNFYLLPNGLRKRIDNYLRYFLIFLIIQDIYYMLVVKCRWKIAM